MIKALNHVGIAVKDLEKSAEKFKKILGIEPSGFETIAEQKVKIASFELNGVSLELMEPIAEDSPISKFLEKRGEGIHHLAFETDDCASELERLISLGIETIDKEPRKGSGNSLVAFLKPKSTNGVLTELYQSKK